MRTQSDVNVTPVEWIALVLSIVGAINWGLVGIGNTLDANFNLVDLLLGGYTPAENAVYILVGLAGLYLVYFGYQLYAAPTDRRAGEAEAAR